MKRLFVDAYPTSAGFELLKKNSPCWVVAWHLKMQPNTSPLPNPWASASRPSSSSTQPNSGSSSQSSSSSSSQGAGSSGSSSSYLSSSAEEMHVFGEDSPPSWLVALDPSVVGAAASRGDLQEVNKLVRSGADPCGVNPQGQTPLLLACKSNNPQRRRVVARLLDLGANVNRCDVDHCSPLLAATMWSDRAVVELLLERSASIDHQNMSGYTALHAAAQMEQPGIACMLIQRGAAVDMLTQSGGTPLAVACMRGSAMCASLLLKAGASVDGPRLGPAPLYMASMHAQASCVELLLEAKASLSRTSYGKRCATPPPGPALEPFPSPLTCACLQHAPTPAAHFCRPSLPPNLAAHPWCVRLQGGGRRNRPRVPPCSPDARQPRIGRCGCRGGGSSRGRGGGGGAVHKGEEEEAEEEGRRAWRRRFVGGGGGGGGSR